MHCGALALGDFRGKTLPPNATGGCHAGQQFVVELCSLSAAKKVSTDLLDACQKQRLVGQSGFDGI